MEPTLIFDASLTKHQNAQPLDWQGYAVSNPASILAAQVPLAKERNKGKDSLRWIIAFLFLSATNVAADHELEGRDITGGQTLYAENCASCHGANLEGQPNWRTPDAAGVHPAPPHDATGHTWHHDNGLLFDYTKQGGAAALARRGVTNFSSGMPAFEEVLSDNDIWDILAYIRSTWPPHEQQVQASRNQSH